MSKKNRKSTHVHGSATVGAINADYFRQDTVKHLAEQVAELQGHETGTKAFREACAAAVDAAELYAYGEYLGLVENDMMALSMTKLFEA